MISWWFSTDGVGTHAHGLIEDCFFKVNDDALKLYHSDTTVRRYVIWQMENGAPFQISWNMPGKNAGFRVSDCDVIRVEHSWKNDNEAVFCAIHDGSGHMSDYLFEDSRIEGVTLDHVRVGDRLLTSVADNFDVDTNTVRNVRLLPEFKNR